MSTKLKIVARPSPNHDARPPGGPIDMLILHYTGMKTAEEALERLTDPAAKVSAHYTIDEDGTVYAHVDEARRAWHAGVAHWAGASDINARSVGIEIVNPGHEFGYRDFTGPQMAAVIALSKDIIARHGIAPHRVLGHSDVAPTRKEDPGEKFPWAALAAEGIGLWSAATGAGGAALKAGDQGAAVSTLQTDLRRFGYGLAPSGVFDAATTSVVTAFQRHFRPTEVTGAADGETRARLTDLLEMASL